MTKPMKTEHLPSGAHGKPHPEHPVHPDKHPKPTPAPTDPPVSATATLSTATKGKAMTHDPKHKLTPEEYAAGKTPNSGKLKKDGTPVPGQDAAHDAERAAERAAEAAGGGEEPEGTPEPTPEPKPEPPVV